MKNLTTTLFALLSAAACVSACSSTDTATTPKPPKADASTGAGGGGAGDNGTGGDTTAPLDDSGSAGSSGGGGTVADGAPLACIKVPAGGVITDFATPCPADGSTVGQACFGVYNKTVNGGTWAAYPPIGGGADAGPDTDQEAGAACTSFPSKSTFTASTSTGVWVLSGMVSTWSGTGIWLAPCVNATGFTGIEFTIGGQAGPNSTMTITGSQLSNWANPAVGGTCTSGCAGSTAIFTVPATPTVVKVPWTDFTGGSPNDSIDDPSKLIQFQWQLDWQCDGSVAPYTANVTIDDLKFY
jgi:hypothetical protein